MDFYSNIGSLNNSWFGGLPASHLSKWAEVEDTTDTLTLTHVCFLPWPSPWNRQWRNIKNKTLWHTWRLCFSNSQLPFDQFQHHHHNGVYISQLGRFSRACAQSGGFLYRAQLLTQSYPKQGYVAPTLKSSLQRFYSRDHDLVDRYEISISQMTMDFLLFTYIFYSMTARLLPDVIVHMSNTVGVL